MAELVRHPLIDEILDAHRDIARGEEKAYEGYRSHAHRLLNFVRALTTTSETDDEKVAVAAAFHDLRAFDSGLDYLGPSIEDAARFLRESGRAEWDREVALMIALHHRLRPYHGEHARLVEPFRRADLNDFTMGLVRAGVPRDVRRAADAQFPVTEFIPKKVARLAVSWAARHPHRPAPVFRGGAALRRTGRD